MKKDDVGNMLSRMEPPNPENMKHQQEFKIPLLRFKRSSRTGLWLLVLPAIVALTVILKHEMGISGTALDTIGSIFNAVDRHQVFTFFIPVIFIGLPLLAMIINLLAFCHCAQNRTEGELLITVKYRPVNILVFLVSLMILVFFLLPDMLSF